MDIVKEGFGLLFAAVVIWFLWSVILYFAELTSEEAKRHMKPEILSSITALLVLMIIYALVEWIRASVGL